MASKLWTWNDSLFWMTLTQIAIPLQLLHKLHVVAAPHAFKIDKSDPTLLLASIVLIMVHCCNLKWTTICCYSHQEELNLKRKALCMLCIEQHDQRCNQSGRSTAWLSKLDHLNSFDLKECTCQCMHWVFTCSNWHMHGKTQINQDKVLKENLAASSFLSCQTWHASFAIGAVLVGCVSIGTEHV